MEKDTAKAGVIGWPIRHSLSPAIFSCWFREHGRTGRYNRIACPPDQQAFQTLIKNLKAIGLAGVNVTIPHKRHAFEIATRHSQAAKLLRSANMLTFADDEIIADNSDVTGFLKTLESLNNDKQINTALVLGAGGATPAICYALKIRGCQNIIISNRTSSTAKELMDRFDFVTGIVDWDSKQSTIAEADVIVNTTSLGMSGGPPLELNLENAKPTTIAVDIVYTPLETEFLKTAREAGLKTANGLTMLMHQAVPGYQNWFGLAPDVKSDLRSALHQRLKRKESGPQVVGLTGSIGMGKSTVGKMLQDFGAWLWDADAAVHRLYSKGGKAVAPIQKTFAGVVENGEVLRKRLSTYLMKHPEKFSELEKIVHPLVAEDRAGFISDAINAEAKVIVLDIPLLFETGQAHEFDNIIVVSAKENVRRERVLARPEMTVEKYEAIVDRQMPDAEKQLYADHIIRTDLPMEDTQRCVEHVYKKILEK